MPVQKAHLVLDHNYDGSVYLVSVVFFTPWTSQKARFVAIQPFTVRRRVTIGPRIVLVVQIKTANFRSYHSLSTTATKHPLSSNQHGDSRTGTTTATSLCFRVARPGSPSNHARSRRLDEHGRDVGRADPTSDSVHPALRLPISRRRQPLGVSTAVQHPAETHRFLQGPTNR